MERYDQNEAPRRKKRGGRFFLAALLVLVLCVLGYGTGVALRELGKLRIIPLSQKPPIYRMAQAPSGERVLSALPMEGELPASEIYRLLSPCCVGVTTSTTSTNIFGQVTRGAISGSGFLISADGYLLTNYHVIETALERELPVKVMLWSGQEYTARIVGGDSASDVALLKIQGENFPYATLGSFEETQVGEQIYVIGNPLGELTYSMTAGIVSALDRSIPVSNTLSIDMFQIDAAINSGNSGGPIINRFGQVIGLASAKYSSSGVEGLAFGIPINNAIKVVDDVSSYGYVRGRPWLGITVGNASDYGFEPGGIVREVVPGSAAEKAGLRVDDIILEAGGRTIGGLADLLRAKNDWSAGDTIELLILREGERITIRITLDEEKP
ncbi:MAG: trypsin-like peptidase domain-containing protein [Oscillospiraceae bacterium]|nr:trypsin-like peptidase domain-containing protein [Oscillospiraceae bacterium]